MPKKLDRCTKHLIKSGKSTSSAFAICTASLKAKSPKQHKKKAR